MYFESHKSSRKPVLMSPTVTSSLYYFSDITIIKKTSSDKLIKLLHNEFTLDFMLYVDLIT